MKESYLDRSIVAIPQIGIYDYMPRDEVIAKYKKMSTIDFEKQFETKDALKFDESQITIDLGWRKGLVKRIVCPFTRFDKWNGKDAKQSMMESLIYTELDGYPIGEYCSVRNANPEQIDIVGDLDLFYRCAGWKTRIYNKSALISSFIPDGQGLLQIEPTVLEALSSLFFE